jgi:hypothetical protein
MGVRECRRCGTALRDGARYCVGCGGDTAAGPPRVTRTALTVTAVVVVVLGVAVAASLVHGSPDASPVAGPASGPDAVAPGTMPPAVTTPGAAVATVPRIASVDTTSTAPAGFDSHNVPVTYDATNLVDRREDTAWRAVGDGTGQQVTIRLAGVSKVHRVGLLPGYAKRDPYDGTDRWPQNRRPVAVRWTFDDGTSVVQRLADRPVMQTIAVGTATTTVTMTLLAVTAPGDRDFTAVSEITVA